MTAHYRQYLGAANCRIVLSGPVDQDVIRQVDTFLGENWNPEAQKVNHLIKTQFTSGISKVERKGALQTAIQIGRPIMQRLEPEYPAFLLLNTVLGGYFGSRLMTNIREDKGYTYGIHSQVNAYRQAATLIIATEAGAAVSEATHHEIAFEMNRLQTETIEKEELELVKSYLTGSYLKGLDGVYNLAEKFRTIQAFGLSLDYYPSLLKKIQDTGADELQELAKKYLILDQMTEVWVGAIR